ncbi:hypothetical protein [Streptomyces sp. NPDC058620]
MANLACTTLAAAPLPDTARRGRVTTQAVVTLLINHPLWTGW